MSTTSVSFKHALGNIVLDVDWSGSSVCGQGPDDESPDIDDVKGWIEDDKGACIRDLTKEEVERLQDDEKIMDLVFQAIHDAYNDSDDGDYL